MIEKIIQIFSKLFGEKGLINTNIKNEKNDTSGNTVINNGNDNTTIIGNNIDLSPKFEMEMNDSNNDEYTLNVDIKKYDC